MKPRATTRLTTKLERNLLAYAALATATMGAGLPSEGSVVYTPAHVVLESGGLKHFDLDVNSDGISDFKFIMNTYIHSGTYNALFADDAGTLDERRGSVQVGGAKPLFAARRDIGGEIGPNRLFRRVTLMFEEDTNLNFVLGYWFNTRDRYVGLKFTIGAETHFGWARLRVFSLGQGPVKLKAVLSGYAYETIPDKPIIAGDKGTGASLGHLALGAAGRKSRIPATGH